MLNQIISKFFLGEYFDNELEKLSLDIMFIFIKPS